MGSEIRPACAWDSTSWRKCEISPPAFKRLEDMALVKHQAAGDAVAPVVAVRDAQNLGDGQGGDTRRADGFAGIDDAMKHDASLASPVLGYSRAL